MSEDLGHWYRYRDVTYGGGVDEHGDPIRGDLGPMVVLLDRIAVIKRTPKGVWLAWGRNGGPTWVSNTARRRWARPTKEEAKASYEARKIAQVRILKARLADAMDALYLTDEIDVTKDVGPWGKVARVEGWRRRR